MGAKLWYFHPKTFQGIQLVICLSRCVLSSSSAPVNFEMFLKQLEPQQMQMHFLRVKRGERNRQRGSERGVTDTAAARDTFTAAFKTNTCCRGRSAWGTSEILQFVTARLWLDNETALTELQHYKWSLKSSSLNFGFSILHKHRETCNLNEQAGP